MNHSRQFAGSRQTAQRALYGREELFRLIRPRSIAVVGASVTPGSFGHRTLLNTAFGYTGNVYPINPKHSEILGRRCYPTLESLPEIPDCVVLSVPATQVVELVEKCADLGVGGVVLYSSGFMETGDPRGIAEQTRLVEIARSSGIRILGPNCIGIMNFVDRVGLSFQPGLNELPMIAGPVGLVVQSGALGFIIAQGMQRGIGFSYNIAPGNSCDVDICDLINFMVEDESTRAIACVFEGIADGERFEQAAMRALKRGKPLVVYKMGRNDLSRQTALSHTGTLTGSNAAYESAFRKTGIIAVDDFEAVLETVNFFTKSGKPVATGVAVMSASGGAAVMAADKAEDVGLLLPPLSPQTSAKLREKMPDFGSSANPCDITAASLHDNTMYGHCIEAFAKDPSYAAVVVPMMTAYAPATVERATYLCEVAAGLTKPVCIVWLNEWYQGPGSEVYDRSHNLSMFRSMRRCLMTLKSWMDYHEQRDALLAEPPPRITSQDAAAAARKLLDRSEVGGPLTERASKALLAAYGIAVTREELALTEDDAVEIAGRIGYPVVLKGESAAITHKTDAGIVHLRLQDAEAVRAAFRVIHQNAMRLPGRPSLAGVLVQEMIEEGVEILAGMRNDPQFGPSIVCGLGGVLVEVLHDTASALTPVSREQAAGMLRSLKGYRLLTGYRGMEPVALGVLAETIARFSELAHDLGDRLAEFDVNPIRVDTKRAVALDAVAIICGKERLQ